MAKFQFDIEAQKKAAKSIKEKSGSIKELKLEKEKNYVLVLPSTEKDMPVVFETLKHTVIRMNKYIASCASPAFEKGGKDKIKEYGWKLKAKYENSENPKLKDLWKNFMPKNDTYVNVLNKDDLEAGPLVMKLPKPALDILLSEIEESESLQEICDLDEGRWLIIKHNGEKGLKKRYVSQFSKNQAKLVESELVDEDKIAKDIRDLRTLQPAVDEADVEKVFKYLKEEANKIIAAEDEDADMDEEDEVEDEVEVEDGEDEDEDDDVELDEVDTKKAKKSSTTSKASGKTSGKSSKTAGKKTSKYDLDEEDDD